jgi:hypothetical protein
MQGQAATSYRPSAISYQPKTICKKIKSPEVMLVSFVSASSSR